MRACVPLCRLGWFLSRLNAQHRLLSTVSPLEAAFNTKPANKVNFNFMRKNAVSIQRRELQIRNFYTPPHDSALCLSICFSFPDDNLSKHQWIFMKLGMCIDIVEIWFGIATGQISSIF